MLSNNVKTINYQLNMTFQQIRFKYPSRRPVSL